MTRPAPINGVRLRLRPVDPSDAGYIHRLRTNPRLNTYLSAVTGTVEDQRDWIERYLSREAEGREVYFVIERLVDGRPCGTVRLYGIGTDRFTWGSWILDDAKPAKAALESTILSFGCGFEPPARTSAEIDVRRENTRAIAFYRRFGMAETAADGVNIYFTYSRARFLADRPGFMAILQANADG